MRLLIPTLLIATTAASPGLAQDDNPAVPLINAIGGFIQQKVQEQELKNSPEYRMNEIQPGGLTRAQVIIVQQKLLERGYDIGTPDGIVGPKTMAIVAQVQQKVGAPINGLPDARFLEALLQQ